MRRPRNFRVGLVAVVAWAACDLRPQTADSPPPPAPECVQGRPGRLVVERAGQRVMNLSVEQLSQVRGAHTPQDGRYRGRLLVPLSMLGAQKLEVVPCEGDPVHLAATDDVALTANKRGELKIVNTDGTGEPLVRNLRLLRVLE